MLELNDNRNLQIQLIQKEQKTINQMIGSIDAEEDYTIERQNSFKFINISLSNQHKGDNENMKNITKRKDGRWQYSKTINKKRIFIYAKTQKELLKKINSTKTKIKNNNYKNISFYELAEKWLDTYKKDIVSSRNYYICLKKYLSTNTFKKDIRTIKYEEIQNELFNIKATKMAQYCFFIIKGVYKQAIKQEIINKDISNLLDKPKHKNNKGKAFKINEQKTIIENLNLTPIKNEIMFYLLTGCRRNEALNIKYNDIDFKHLTIYINGTKTNSSKRYIPISTKYAEFLKDNFNTMFKEQKDYYTHKFKEFLNKLNIKNKTLHDLRHTYSTNLYYLGVPDKQRQVYLGHSSIIITNDIYTTLELNITKNDILNLYKDLYPKF